MRSIALYSVSNTQLRIQQLNKISLDMHSKYVVRLHFALLMEKVFHRLHGLFIAKFQGRMTTIFHTASRDIHIEWSKQFK